MPNYLLKRDALNLEPMEFEELSGTPSRVIRPAGTDPNPAPAPLRARRIIRNDAALLQADAVDICSASFSNETVSDALGDNFAGPEDKLIDATELEALRAEWDLAWQQKLEAAEKQARIEAFAKGFEAAKEELQSKVNQSQQDFHAGLGRLQDTWDSLIKRSETLLLEIALEIVEFLIDAPLPDRFTHATERALLEALELLSRDVPISLSLNPVDLLHLQESGILAHIKDQFPSIRLDPQATLKEGNWIVQTPRQAIRRVSDELLANLRDQFGLSDATHREIDLKPQPASQTEQEIPPVMNVTVTTSPIPSADDLDTLPNMSFSPASSTAKKTAADYLDLPTSSVSSTRTS